MKNGLPVKNHGLQTRNMGSPVSTIVTTPFLLSILFFVSFLLTGCDIKFGDKKKKDDDKDIAAPVLVSKAETGDISSYLRLNATIEPVREVEIYSRAFGQVIELRVEEGDGVHAGDLLLKLDDSEQVLSLNRSKAILEKERAHFKSADELYRKQMLAEDEYRQLKLALEDAEIALDQAELALAYTLITAPFDGTIALRYIDFGDRVDLSRPLFRLVDQSSLLINGWISESDQHLLQVSQEVLIVVSGKEDRQEKATLIRISPVVDPAYGKVKATFQITDPNPDLKPGQFVEIRLTLETHKDVLLLPKQAIVYESGNPLVFVYRDSLVFRRPVEIGIQTGTNAEVIKGIDADEFIIIEGQATIRDSSRVKPVNPPSPES